MMINGVILPIRELPIQYLIQSLLECQQDKYQEGHQQATKLSTEQQLLSEFASDGDNKRGLEASKKDVQIIEQNHPFY